MKKKSKKWCRKKKQKKFLFNNCKGYRKKEKILEKSDVVDRDKKKNRGEEKEKEKK